MDPRSVCRNYIRQLLTQSSKLKVLLLDDETLRIISLLYTQSELLAYDVILIDKLSRPLRTTLTHVTAVVFIRPTADNVHLLRTELRHPHFPSYAIYFSNAISRPHVEEIADADAHERVTLIRENFADFYTLSQSLVSFAVLPCVQQSSASSSSASAALQNPQLRRTVDATSSLILALKLAPDIRYQASSALCANIAQRLAVRIDQDRQLFDFRPRSPPPMLLLLDRREDPVTPLLNQWTYEAMLHELLGIHYNRISLRDAPAIPDELRDLVVDDVEDDFFRSSRFLNFGDLGASLQKLVDAFQRQSNSNSRVATIEDMMKFVTNFPEFRKSSSNVSKHVALAGELSRLVGQTALLAVSELEQDIACREAENDHRRQVLEALRKPDVTLSDKLRLVMLYALRYEGVSDGGLPMMKEALLKAGVGAEGVQLVTAVKEYAGVSKRSGDLFSNRSFLAKATSSMRRGIGGVENVYTQHEPLLVYTLDSLFRSRLKNVDFPLVRADDSAFAGGDAGNGGGGGGSEGNGMIAPAREVIVVMVGGATYEEAKCISAINGGPHAFVPPEGSTTTAAAAAAAQVQAKVVLAGTCIHNSTSFAVEIAQNAIAQRQEHFIRPTR